MPTSSASPTDRASVGTRPTPGRGRRAVAIARGALVACVVLYVPVAASATWYAFVPGAPHLLDDLNATLTGDRYAHGSGSVAAVREIDYATHRWIMLAHTTLGAVALGIALAQGATARRRLWAWHRRSGRLFSWAVSASMGAAMAFLLVAPPEHFIGARAFRLQLWELAGCTLGAAHLARRAARRQDLAAHRAWALLAFSFLLTAPLLRLLWTALGPLFPAHDMLTNLEVGSVLLAVVAPAGAAITYLATHGTTTVTGPPIRWSSPRLNAPSVALAVLGTGVVAHLYADLAGSALATAYPWFGVVPTLACTALCLVATQRARRRSDASGERGWRTLLVGVALSPWAVVAASLLGSPALGPVDGYLTALMVAPGVPITASLAVIVSGEAGQVPRRRAPGPGLRAPQ